MTDNAVVFDLSCNGLFRFFFFVFLLLLPLMANKVVCWLYICEQVDAGETSSAETWFTSFTPTVCHITSSLSICHLSSIYTFNFFALLYENGLCGICGVPVLLQQIIVICR